jgi:hypothetical protein
LPVTTPFGSFFALSYRRLTDGATGWMGSPGT